MTYTDKNFPVRAMATEELIRQIVQEIAQINSEGELAPRGAWIVRHRSKGGGGAYWYFKWQSKEAIFTSERSGKPAKTKYIGKVGTPEYIGALKMQLRRAKVEALEQAFHTLALGVKDLDLEAEQGSTRDNRLDAQVTQRGLSDWLTYLKEHQAELADIDTQSFG